MKPKYKSISKVTDVNLNKVYLLKSASTINYIKFESTKEPGWLRNNVRVTLGDKPNAVARGVLDDAQFLIPVKRGKESFLFPEKPWGWSVQELEHDWKDFKAQALNTQLAALQFQAAEIQKKIEAQLKKIEEAKEENVT